ncbi:MAG TPA: PKD domain-containing protein [Vicinamibacterales bacterium]|nr:PKD domain-containing protein [Vicinamibacterales bacterium]
MKTTNRRSVLSGLTRTTIGRGIARLLIVCFVAELSLMSEIVRAEPGIPGGLAAGTAAAAVAAFGPKDYVRSTGKPEVVTDTFAAQPGNALLHITNGGSLGQYARVSSAVITLNGTIIVAPSELGQQITTIDKIVPLNRANTLSVELRSQPNSGLSIGIFPVTSGGNRAPIANAGADQATRVGRTVTLNGALSSDPDGDAITFRWTPISVPAGSVAHLSDSAAVAPTFTVDVPGTYDFALKVNDGTVDSAADTVRVTTENSPPTANAGPDQTTAVGATVTLDGRASSDVDGNPLRFLWAFVSRPAGSAASLSNQTAQAPTFTVDRAGSYVVRLIVNDGALDSAPDTVTISTSNSAPTANAGPDQTAPVGTNVALDGSHSLDADGDALTFLWTFTSRPAGSGATLSSSTAVTPGFAIDRPGSYALQLVVNDGALSSAPDTVIISTTNSAPVANAGADRSAVVGQTVTLDGSQSADVDGDPLTFNWALTSAPSGSTATLSNPAAIAPSFTVDRAGTYVAQLIVNDGTANSAADTVTITTANSKPTANAGPDQTAAVGTIVTLDGSHSVDVDGNALTYAWAFTSRPAGSAATLSDATAVNPSFTIDRAGTYALQLIVNDGVIDSSADTVLVSTTNSAPVADAGTDRSALVGQTITLDGSHSADVDGDTLTFRWALTSVPAGSAASLTDLTAIGPSFTVDRPGTYVAQLIVNDGTADSAPDTITISTTNSAPVANAGTDQSAPVGGTIVLNGGGSTDADGDALTYSWAFASRPAGSAATLSNPSGVASSFVIDRAGDYVVQLTVNDGTSDSAPDSVTVSTTNSRPVANAGADQSSLVGGTVALDGRGSSDADLNDLMFRWAITGRPAGSSAALSDATSAQPAFVADVAGMFVVQLIVNDGFVDSDPDTATIVVRVAVPGVVGKTESQARSMLEAAGLTVGAVTTAYDDTVPAGSVTQQTPSVGTIVAAGTAVDLIVSLGAAATVPDVTGLTEPDAGTALAARGLVVGAVTKENSITVAAGTVIRQAPLANTIVVRGSAVDLVVSLGAAVPVLSSIAVTPADTSVPRGRSQQYIATGTFSDGHTEDLTVSVTWQSANVGVATIGAAGLASALDPGTTTIRAIKGAVTGATGLTVGPATLASIVVTPANPVLLTTESLQLVATGVLTDGTSQSLAGQVNWVSTDPAKAGINATTGIATGLVPGPTTINATKGSITGSTSLTVQAKVSDSTPPAVAITAPANNSTVTNSVNIIGTATDANFSKYVLEYAPAGSTAFTPISTGTSQVANGVLGVLDPTLLLNDLYTVQVRVFDRGGNITAASRVYQVSRDVKVGNFTLTFQDLNVPMSGLPITVNRVYDSRDKRSGDFGIGWRLDIQTLRLRTNRPMYSGWNGTKSGGFLPNYCVTAGDDHKVSITLADGTVEEFDMALDTPCQQIQPPQTANVIWNRRPGTRGTLASIDQSDVWINGSFPGTVELLDGSLTDLFDPQTFRYTTYEGMQFVINKTAGVQSAKDPDGNTLTFTPNGIIHSSGASVTFTRDAQGRITKMTAPDGKISNYTTDANGDLASYADAAANTTRYYYNLSHGVIEIVDPRGLRPLKNEYDNTGRLVAHIDAQGRRVEYSHVVGSRQEVVLDRNGGQTVYEYDAAGNVIKVTDPLGKVTQYTFDARGNKLSETNPLGKTTTFTYDANNNLTSETDALSRTSTRTFNARGQALTLIDPLGRVTTNTYNAGGNLLTSRDAAGNTTTYTYDARGNQLTATNALGQTITSVYDASGRQTRRTDTLGNVFNATYDASGRRLTETNPRGGVTRSTYDAAGREVSVEDSLGNITRSEYDSAGNRTASIDATGRRTEYTYDAANRLLSTKFPDATTVVNTYDAEGNQIAMVDQLGRKTEVTYNSKKQRTQTKYADGTVETYTYDDAGRQLTATDQLGNVAESQYDAVGREIKTIDALGNATSSVYDNADNLISRTDSNGRTTGYAYDQLNRLTVITLPGGQTSSQAYDAAGREASQTDAAGRTTLFQYDANGHVTTVTDAAGGVTRFEYDPAGNRTAVVDARNNRTTFTYNLANRLTATTLPNGGVENYSYDAAGRMIAKQDALGRTITFAYDANGRLVTRGYPDASSVQFTYTPTGKRASASDGRGTTHYAYDIRDRLTSLTYPDGKQITYSYDATGNLVSISSLAGTISYIYDKGRLHQVVDAAGRVTTFTYDAVGNRTGLSYPNGTSAAYVYDANDRLSQLTHNGISGQLANYAFTLDATGARTRIDESTGAVKNYSYDVLSRLTEERVTDLLGNPIFQNDYSYDAVGNRLTKTSSTAGGAATPRNYGYNNADQLVTENGITYTYDLNGNLTSKTDAAGVTAYQYDFDNRLVRLTEPAGQATTYRYDADGNRVETQNAAGTVRYLVDTNRELAQVLAEYTPAGALSASFVYADDLISMTRGAQVAFYHFDGNGSTRLLTDLSGAVTDTYQYDAFGTLVARTGTTDNPFLFTGQPLDANSGFYYMRARWYSPSTGRFLTLDAHAAASSDPRSLHRYVYAANDPANHADPSGRFGLGSLSISISMSSILSGIASLSVNVLIDYVLSKITGAEFNIFVSVGTALAFGAIGKGLSLGMAAVRRSPNTIRLLQAAARRGMAEHAAWMKMAREALSQAGRVEGFCPTCFTLDKGIRDLAGKVVRTGKKYARPDMVDYANHMIMDLKPVPKAIFDAGEEVMEKYLNSTYAAQKKFYIETYARARGVSEDAITFLWDVYVK